MDKAKAGVQVTLSEWISCNEKKGDPYFSDRILVDAVQIWLDEVSVIEGFKDAVVIGSRSLHGLQYLCEHIKVPKVCHSLIVYIDASFELLKRQYESRESIFLSREEFLSILDRDRCMGLPKLKRNANRVIINDGIPENFYRDLHSTLLSLLYDV